MPLNFCNSQGTVEATGMNKEVKGLHNGTLESGFLNKLQNLMWRELSKLERRNLGEEDLGYVLHSR